MTTRKKVGEIFIEQGLITAKTTERVLARSIKVGRKLGGVLEEMGLITGEELANALALQFGHRLVSNFARFSFSADLLSLIPADVALQHLIFPLKMENGTLSLAMADPTETKIVTNIAANNKLTLLPYISTRKDILAAISKHYLKRDLSAPTAKSVLVVEDDRVTQAMLKNILAREDYRVIQAMEGLEGYKSALTESPQVIITDKEMPKLGGYGLFDALRSMPETRNIPVILLTGDPEAEEEARAFEKGFFDFIAKPVKDVTLITRVKRAFQAFEEVFVTP